MAELLVRTEDRTTGDPNVDAQNWKRGMVVTVQEDGWPWGTLEVNNPVFLIVKVPGMTVAAASVFLGNLIEDPMTDFTSPRRSFKVDLDHPSLTGRLAALNGLAHRVITLNTTQLAAVKAAVTVSNPLVVGT